MKTFVATSMLLSEQKTCFVATNTGSDKHVFVATKGLLVADPASDTNVVTVN